MKKILGCVLALSTVVLAHAQKITVIDNVTMEPVVNASVFAHVPTPTTRQWGTVTNENGEADITQIASEDSLYVRHPQYGMQGFTMQQVKDWKFTVRLAQREILMHEVVFSANRTEENKADVPYTMEVINSKDVTFSNPQTTGDALQNTGQVFVQRSQLGGSSPVLRGFEASRVLMVVDGVRMNNAIYRSGHLADCITVDQNMLERTEIIFGPSSTMYGSDALGGTMHFYSKRPMLSTTDKMNVNTNAMYRMSTANNESTMHVDMNFGLKNFASLTSFTYSSFGDLRMGANANPAYGNYDWCREYVERIDGKDSVVTNSDPLVQKFSGYRQMDITQKFLYKSSEKVSHLINFQYSTSPDGVPRYDRLQQRSGGNLRYAEWNYGPQNRLLASYTLTLHGDSSLYDRANFIVAAQKIDQDRITRRRNNNNRTTQEEDVMVYSLNADLVKAAGKHELRYGLEITHNIVGSTATNTDITTGAVTDAITRYADGGSTMTTAAIYLSHSWEISEKLILSDGIRFTMTKLHSEWSDTTFYPFPFKENDQNSFAPSGNIGLVYRPCSAFSTHVMLSTGFRAPNVDDMSKVFESAPGTLIVPNPDLNPEMVVGGELGMDVMLTPNARWSVVGFYSRMLNAIVTQEFTLDGQDSVFYDGAMSQVVAPQNVDQAFITGLTTGLYADFNSHFSFRSTVTATYGRYEDTKNDTLIPLDHIPPVFGQTGIVYHWKGLEAEAYTRYNAWKHIADYSPSGEDNASQATVYGTPAWATLNFRATYQVNKYIGASFACENILDQNYRHFASGISAPGRNFVVALRLHY
jgi:hemoglobin/transferrin/lactoferrin receptor protein